MPTEQNKRAIVSLLGVLTMLWGVVQMALGIFCDLPGDHWISGEGFAPVQRIAGSAFDSNVGTIFVLQGILGLLAGSGVLLRLPWGRILTLIVAIVAILWTFDSVDAYSTQDDVYQWKTALIPFAAFQILFGILVFAILIKNRAAFIEPAENGEKEQGRPHYAFGAWASPFAWVHQKVVKGQGNLYVWSAWASPLVGAVIALVFWLFIVNHEGKRGERALAVVLFYMMLLLASLVAGLAGVFSLLGIRSRRDALNIIPGALLGICINTFIALMCLIAFLLEARNLGG